MISLFAIMRIFLLPEIIPYYMAYFSLMLKVLLNCAVIIHNLSNRNKDKTSNQRLFCIYRHCVKVCHVISLPMFTLEQAEQIVIILPFTI